MEISVIVFVLYHDIEIGIVFSVISHNTFTILLPKFLIPLWKSC